MKHETLNKIEIGSEVFEPVINNELYKLNLAIVKKLDLKLAAHDDNDVKRGFVRLANRDIYCITKPQYWGEIADKFELDIFQYWNAKTVTAWTKGDLSSGEQKTIGEAVGKLFLKL